jgi:hypothetical protein
VHLDGRAVGCLAHPGVEILSFPGFEKENIVAVVELSEFVKLV